MKALCKKSTLRAGRPRSKTVAAPELEKLQDTNCPSSVQQQIINHTPLSSSCGTNRTSISQVRCAPFLHYGLGEAAVDEETRYQLDDQSHTLNEEAEEISTNSQLQIDVCTLVTEITYSRTEHTDNDLTTSFETTFNTLLDSTNAIGEETLDTSSASFFGAHYSSKFSDEATKDVSPLLIKAEDSNASFGEARPQFMIHAKRSLSADVASNSSHEAQSHSTPVSSDVFGATRESSEAIDSSSSLLIGRNQRHKMNKPVACIAPRRRMTVASEPRHDRQQIDKEKGRQVHEPAECHIVSHRSIELSGEQSYAFQELIQGSLKRPSHFNASVSDNQHDSVVSIDAALGYGRMSPSGERDSDNCLLCDLCGGLAKRLTTMEPCGHRACSVCCQSGINQVTATPPRPHTCAACHQLVISITLHKENNQSPLLDIPDISSGHERHGDDRIENFVESGMTFEVNRKSRTGPATLLQSSISNPVCRPFSSFSSSAYVDTYMSIDCKGGGSPTQFVHRYKDACRERSCSNYFSYKSASEK